MEYHNKTFGLHTTTQDLVFGVHGSFWQKHSRFKNLTGTKNRKKSYFCAHSGSIKKQQVILIDFPYVKTEVSNNLHFFKFTCGEMIPS